MEYLQRVGNMAQPHIAIILDPGSLLSCLLLSAGVSWALDMMDPRDAMYKKAGLSAGIALTRYLVANGGPRFAGTCEFLLSIIVLQVIVLGVVSSGWRGNERMKRISMGCCMVGVNVVGVREAVRRGHHAELVSASGAIEKMLLIVMGGFLLVWVADRILQNVIKAPVEYRRKTFHLVPIIILPVLSQIDFQLFTLMLAGSFYLFLHLELLRFFILPLFQLHPRLISWMKELNSTREPLLWFTHLFLILGLSTTYYGLEGPLKHMSLVLIVGDAAAALVGRKYGRTRIKGTCKSIEGLLGFFISVALMQYFCLHQHGLGLVLLTSLACGLVEVYSGDLDNLALPLSYILLYKAFAPLHAHHYHF